MTKETIHPNNEEIQIFLDKFNDEPPGYLFEWLRNHQDYGNAIKIREKEDVPRKKR